MKLTGRYIDENYNRTLLTYTFTNGSFIEFFSADQESKVRGPRRDILYINECNRINFDTYHQLAIRTAKEIYLDYNPTWDFWVHQELIGNDDVDLLILTYLDNEALPQEIIDELLQARAKGQREIDKGEPGYWVNWCRVYLDGQTGTLQGTIYNNWTEGAFDDSLAYVYGMDFGFQDPDTIIKVAVDSRKMIIYADQVLYKSGQSTGQLAEEAIIATTPESLIAADNAGARNIEDLRQAGLNIVPCQKDRISERIKNIQGYSIVVTPSSTNLIEELRKYSWHDKKSETPIDKWNHCIDAMSYGFNELTMVSEFYFQ